MKIEDLQGQQVTHIQVGNKYVQIHYFNLFITARKRSLRRLCFYMCLSVYQHALQVVYYATHYTILYNTIHPLGLVVFYRKHQNQSQFLIDQLHITGLQQNLFLTL